MDPFFDNFVNYISLLTVLQANKFIIFYEYTNSRHTFPAEYLLKKVTIGLQLPNLEFAKKWLKIQIYFFFFFISVEFVWTSLGHPVIRLVHVFFSSFDLFKLPFLSRNRICIFFNWN